ncbi:hypothetical protein [Synechococcus sp. CC9605]|uniref:hypothetical protein n=1 Tax=Synechococcus sp. (strain CC9605) TaxID=110662 RepID=UPI00005D55F8|nr:hypothetical protein [Synechococcus sp. CC9605]ABB33924.1 hypothetical protein Syncc9605_0148 [Synechococcus sp. CC9605]
MQFLKELHELERDKRYKEYCSLAEKILKEEKNNISPTNSLHIRKRRDYYLAKLIQRENQNFEIKTILDSLSNENLEILKKCCPGFADEKDGKENKKQIEKLITRNTLISTSITKNKNLKVKLEPAGKSLKTSGYYFYQALLTPDLKLKQLKSQSEGEFQGLETVVVSLDNEFMPIFIIDANSDHNEINDLEIIYFPSLIPGGYHYSELVDAYNEFGIIESLNKYTNKLRDTPNKCKIDYLLMKTGHQDIGIGYANEDFRKWIKEVHGIKILKEYDPNCQGTTLAIPQKAYPTISTIVNGIVKVIDSDMDVDSVDILITNEYDSNPLYKLQASFPKRQTESLKETNDSYPYLISKKASENPQYKDIEGPICICPGENKVPYSAHPVLPYDILKEEDINPANKALIILVNTDKPENITEEMILSIHHQSQVRTKKIVFKSNSNNINKLRKRMVKILKEWQIIIDFDIITDVKQLASIIDNKSHILFINENIVLQDSNVISILQSNLNKYNAFSSGCILSYLSSSKKGELYENISCGMYPTFNSFSQSGRLALVAKNLTSFLYSSEINVLSNHYDFCLYNSETILAEIRRNEVVSDLNQFLVQLSCKAVLAGKNNVCSTRLSVQYINYPTINSTITIDRSLTEDIISNFIRIEKQVTNIKELTP